MMFTSFDIFGYIKPTLAADKRSFYTLTVKTNC
jgi:hypothetical protein